MTLELIAHIEPMTLPLWAVLAFSVSMYPLGFMLGTPCSACCGEECNRCINIVYQGSPGYKGPACSPTDEYECEIVIPDEYALPVKIKITGGVDDDLKVNGTLIEDGLYEYLDGCNGAHLVGTYDNGDGYVTTVSSRTVTLTLVDNFGGYTGMNLTVCIDPDNEQKLCLPPTTTCEQPPPVESPCCRRLFVLEECDDLAVFACDEYATEAQCCASTEEDPSVCAENPPVTSCEPTGVVPRTVAPFDCYDTVLYNGGATVSVSGWSACILAVDPCDNDPFRLFQKTGLEWAMNRSFWVPIPCLGAVAGVTETFNLGEWQGLPGDWIVDVTVTLCARSASVKVYSDGNADHTVSINLTDLTTVSVPCNEFEACRCEAYSDDIVEDSQDNGTISVV